MKTNDSFRLKVTGIDKVCAAGEEFGRKCRKEGKTPVFSCEGGCIKGEIARQAANLVAKYDGYARACHGELFTVPQADLANWVRESEKVVIIDGCSLFCHSRIAENIIGKTKLVVFDALSIHREYAHLMDVDDVPEEERKRASQKVADKILVSLAEGQPCCNEQLNSCGCETNAQPEDTCCSS